MFSYTTISKQHNSKMTRVMQSNYENNDIFVHFPIPPTLLRSKVNVGSRWRSNALYNNGCIVFHEE